jgi:lipopolysaccharide/colanic/teichoic acid biosynthesis glycosyltransferase
MRRKIDPPPPSTCWFPAEGRRGPPSQRWYGALKVTLDFVLALVLFVLTLPVLLLAGLLVKLTSPGPILYRQTRLGKDGRPFTLYKIRSMRADSEKNGACWSAKGDPRVTFLGRILRATHLDELPQLINVLKGEMSLVGPRPERPEFIPTLEQAIPRYRERLRVRPGVTGLAQMRLPADTDLESVRQKLLYDLYYVENYGAWLDLRVILATALKMFGVSFQVIGTLFVLPRVATEAASTGEPSAASGQVFVGQLALNPVEQA